MLNNDDEKLAADPKSSDRVLARVHAREAGFEISGFSAKNLTFKGYYSDMDE